MVSQTQFELNIGLSEEEKNDLERMIGEFQKGRDAKNAPQDPASLQKQIKVMNKRLAYLTSMFLAIDRRMQPLYEITRLTFEKSELLNQRIDAIIEALRSGEPLK